MTDNKDDLPLHASQIGHLRNSKLDSLNKIRLDRLIKSLRGVQEPPTRSD